MATFRRVAVIMTDCSVKLGHLLLIHAAVMSITKFAPLLRSEWEPGNRRKLVRPSRMIAKLAADLASTEQRRVLIEREQ
jgi:hypothetical protein